MYALVSLDIERSTYASLNSLFAQIISSLLASLRVMAPSTWTLSSSRPAWGHACASTSSMRRARPCTTSAAAWTRAARPPWLHGALTAPNMDVIEF